MKGKIRKSIKASYLDGIFFSIMFGLTESYLTPFALALGATITQVGFLASFPGLIGSSVQIFSNRLVGFFGSRLKPVVRLVLISTFCWLLAALLAYFDLPNRPVLLILLVSFYNLTANVTGPVWLSIIADYIPYNSKGKFFGRRNIVIGAVTIIASFAAGKILNHYGKGILTGFVVIFSAAFFSRLASWYYLTKMYEPNKKRTAKMSEENKALGLAPLFKNKNFVSFLRFHGLLNIFTMLASPYFAVYLLNDLKFSYMDYTVVMVSPAVAGILAQYYWGHKSDRVGAAAILKNIAVFIPVFPFFWLFTRQLHFIILIQLFAGFIWAGYNFCAVNYLIEVLEEDERIRGCSVFNIVTGSAMFIGAMAGGRLLGILPELFGSAFLFLFAVSGALRLIPVIFFRNFSEVRVKEDLSFKGFFFLNAEYFVKVFSYGLRRLKLRN